MTGRRTAEWTIAGLTIAGLMGCTPTSGPAPAPAAGVVGDTDWPLYGNLGPHSRAVTTISDTAQAYFNEGMQFMYAFGVGSAERSFRMAQRHDPTCAMCFWGEAWALGPYLNGSNVSPERERRAYVTARKARDLASGGGNDVERALADAFLVRYSPAPEAGSRAARDSAYAKVIGSVAQRFPDDLDVGTLRAEAMMLLRPRRGTWDEDDPEVRRIYGALEEVLARDIQHPGACHLYIHATESGREAGRAEACAHYLGDAIPGASHINHMPSHTFNRIGRWGDGVRANQQAWHTDQKAAFGGPPGIYPTHNLHMLLFAASFDGQGAVAMQAARDLARLPQGADFYVSLTLVRFGRWQEILDLDRRPRDPLPRGLWHFARGMASLRTGSAEAARRELRRVDDVIAERTDEDRFRGHLVSDLLAINRAMLEAEIVAADGDRERAIEILGEALPTEDALRYDEPEPLLNPIRHYLGAFLLEEGRAAEAEQVYRDELEDHPNNGWSLFGLARALEAQEKHAAAKLARQQFERAWQRADHWLRSSRY